MPARKWRTRGRIPFALWLCIVVVHPVASLLSRLRYRHIERIPTTGPVLLVVNHLSVLDPLACARLVFDAGPHFLARQSVFRGLAGTILRAAGQIPVARYSTAAHLALTTDATVVPVAQWGPQRVHDYHARELHLRLRTPTDHLVGEPIDLSAVRAEVAAGRPLDAGLLRETTEQMMARVRDQLSELRGEPAPRAVHPAPRREQPGDLSGSAA